MALPEFSSSRTLPAGAANTPFYIIRCSIT
jgi:hypothetical protein